SEPPARRGWMLPQTHLVPARMQVDVSGQYTERLPLPVMRPCRKLGQEIDFHAFRQDVDVREAYVRRVAFIVHRDTIPKQLERVGEAMVCPDDAFVGEEVRAEAVGGEGQRSPRMLLFCQAPQVGAEADLGFDLLLAVAEIVVREDGHHDTTLISQRDLEGLASVVELMRLRETHTVSFLILGGRGDVWQPE